MYYTHGPRLDEVLTSQTPSQTYYYHSGALGSVVSVTDALGTIQSSQRFDAWGNSIDSAGEAQHFGYTGREPDETGLTYYRARYYASELGRFTQMDPIGLAGGVNLYAYVSNKPIIFTDPFGLKPGDIFAVTPASPPTFSDKVNLGTQRKIQCDAKYIHLAIEILPDAEGNRRIAETLTKEGNQIISLIEFAKRNSDEKRTVDVFAPAQEPSKKGLEAANEAAVKLAAASVATSGSNYDWSEILWFSDASDPSDGSIFSNLCNFLSDLAGTGQIAGPSRRNGLIIPSAITTSLNFEFSHKLEAGGGFVVGDIFQ